MQPPHCVALLHAAQQREAREGGGGARLGPRHLRPRPWSSGRPGRSGGPAAGSATPNSPAELKATGAPPEARSLACALQPGSGGSPHGALLGPESWAGKSHARRQRTHSAGGQRGTPGRQPVPPAGPPPPRGFSGFSPHRRPGHPLGQLRCRLRPRWQEPCHSHPKINGRTGTTTPVPH